MLSVPSSATEQSVEAALVGGVDADDGVADLAVHVVDGPGDALAAVARVTVPELDGFVGARARPARDGGSAARARDELDLHLDGGVAAGVEDLPADDVLDKGHDAVAPVDSVATVDGHHP